MEPSRTAPQWTPRSLARILYYLAILLGLIAIYGRGDVPTAGFIYQAF
jgi:hypothetical protein